MPSSLPAAIQYIIAVYENLLPESVLDIGIGWGKYGLLAREYLSGKKELKRLDGVEAWEPYIGPIQKAIYDNIYLTDIRSFEPEVDYDLILFVDVIEHMDKSNGKPILSKLLPRCKLLLISTPKGFVPQEAEFGNPFEVHRSGWVPEDFAEYKTEIYADNNYHFFIGLRGGLYEDISS